MGRIVWLTDERNVRPGLRGERERGRGKEKKEKRKKKDRKEEREGRFEPVLIRC